MKRKLFIVFFLFLFQIGISQTGRFVHGKVVHNENPIKGVEVVSLNTQNIAITDSNGLFSIIVNPKDVLVFISKYYETKKVYLDPGHVENYNFTVSLVQKKEQLEEIVITSISTPKFDSKKIVDESHMHNLQSSPKNPFIKDATIENGVDFVRLFKDVKKIVAKK